MSKSIDMRTFVRSVSSEEDDIESTIPQTQYSTATSSIIGKWKASFKRKITNSPTASIALRNNEKRDIGATISIGQLSFDEFIQDYPSDSMDTDVLSVKICKEGILTSIQDMMRQCNGDIKILEAIDDGRNSVRDLIKNASKEEKKIALLWCAFLKRRDLLPEFIPETDLEFSTPEDGLTALHLAAFSGSPDCVKFLLHAGAEISTPKYTSPLHCAALGKSNECISILLKAGANVNLNHKDLKLCEPEDSPLHAAIKADSPECINQLISAGADVNAIGQGGLTPLHVAVDLRFINCVKALLESSETIKIDALTQDKRGHSSLHLAAEEECVEMIQILLYHGANADIRNLRGQTPLHVAARVQSVECIRALLPRSDVNAGDADKRTPLHAAVGKADLAAEAAELLAKAPQVDINKTDRYGHTPLHVAALNELPTASAVLIRQGADLTARTKRGATALGLVVRKAPAALYAIEELLDSSIRMSYETHRDRDCELKLDFRSLLQGPGSVEVSLLSTFIAEEHPELLQHPLCQAFLHLKWQTIRKFYIGRLALSFLFVLFLSLYVLTYLTNNDCIKYVLTNEANETLWNNTSDSNTIICKNDTMLFNMHRNTSLYYYLIKYIIPYTLILLTAVELMRKLYGLIAAVFAPTAVSSATAIRIYFTQFDNYFEWFALICTFSINNLISGNENSEIKTVSGAFAILAGWGNFMTMIGQLPLFGAYVAMYSCVLREFIKLLAAYLWILIGFAISFCVVFRSVKEFSNPFYALVKVLVMMTGELEFKDLIFDDDKKGDGGSSVPIFATIIFVMFLLLVTVALMNLLVGIAVHDIHGLRTSAGLAKLVRQADLVNYVETALSGCGNCAKITKNNLFSTKLRCVHNTRQTRSNSTILHIKPHNLMDTRLPRDIVRAAFDVAKCHRSTSSMRGTTFPRGLRTPYNRQSSSDSNVCASTMTRKEIPQMTVRRRRTTYIKNDEAEKEINLSHEIDVQEKLKQLSDDVDDLRQILMTNQDMLRALIAAKQPISN